MTGTGRLAFIANLTLLFADLPLQQRPAAAKKCGFDAVELWWPFSEPVPRDSDLNLLAESLEEADVQLLSLNFDAGDMAIGDRGLLCLPDQGNRFMENVDCVAEFARRTGTKIFNALYGNEGPEVDGRPAERDRAIERLAYAADKVGAIGGIAVVETQNRVDSPRYALVNPDDALTLVTDVVRTGHRDVGFLLDVYHVAMAGYDVIATIDRCHPILSHVQIADAPGRHEPGTGGIDFHGVLDRLGAVGYRGLISAEYRPVGEVEEGLSWRSDLSETYQAAVIRGA